MPRARVRCGAHPRAGEGRKAVRSRRALDALPVCEGSWARERGGTRRRDARLARDVLCATQGSAPAWPPLAGGGLPGPCPLPLPNVQRWRVGRPRRRDFSSARSGPGGVSFAIARASASARGPHGAGKSTLVGCRGARRPDTGAVWVGDWTPATARRSGLARRVGWCFQHADQQLFASPSAMTCLTSDRAARVGTGGGAAHRRCPRDLELTPMPATSVRLPAFRSSPRSRGAGPRARAAVLDEPTIGLDRHCARGHRALPTVRRGRVLVITHD